MTENRDSVDKATTVDHADVVHHADVADEVVHADRIGVVTLTGEPLRSNATRRRKYTRDIAQAFTVIFALIVMGLVLLDKQQNEHDLRNQLTELTSQRTAADKLTADKLECTRRFQDTIDATTETQLVLMGEFLVTITQIPPGPDRETAVKANVTELDVTNRQSRKAINDKVKYNNQGNPLPCPLQPTEQVATDSGANP